MHNRRWFPLRKRLLRLVLLVGAIAAGLWAAGGVLAYLRPETIPPRLLALYPNFLLEPAAPDFQSLPRPQSVAHGNTAITLASVVASGSQTVVELHIDDPAIGTGNQSPDMTFAPLREGSTLLLRGFRDSNIYRYVRTVEPGRYIIRLDLAPVADFSSPVTIEVPYLQKRNVVTGGWDTLPGPWSFTFVPKVTTAASSGRTLSVDQVVEKDDVRVHLKEVQLSATETVASFQATATGSSFLRSAAPPELSWAGTAPLKGSTKGQLPDGTQMVSFPPLPPGVSEVKVSFPAYLITIPTEATIRVPLV